MNHPGFSRKSSGVRINGRTMIILFINSEYRRQKAKGLGRESHSPFFPICISEKMLKNGTEAPASCLSDLHFNLSCVQHNENVGCGIAPSCEHGLRDGFRTLSCNSGVTWGHGWEFLSLPLSYTVTHESLHTVDQLGTNSRCQQTLIHSLCICLWLACSGDSQIVVQGFQQSSRPFGELCEANMIFIITPRCHLLLLLSFFYKCAMEFSIWHLNRSNAEVDVRIQLSSFKPDCKGICKTVKKKKSHKTS